MAIIEDYSPITLGDTLTPFAPQIMYTNGTPFVLTGIAITMKMTCEDGTVKTCDPTKWTIDNAALGLAHYAWQAADVSGPAGMWKLDITLTSGGQFVHADTKLLQILPAP